MKKIFPSLIIIVATVFLCSCGSSQIRYLSRKPLVTTPPAKSITIPANTINTNRLLGITTLTTIPKGTYPAKQENSGGYFYPVDQPILAKDFVTIERKGGIFWRKGKIKPDEIYLQEGESVVIYKFPELLDKAIINK